MTTPQKTLYFRLWGAAFKANWLARDGAVFPNSETRNPWTKKVEPQDNWPSNMDADTLRRRCHMAACGQNISSKKLTNAQLDRVLCLFKLLADPGDLDSVLLWDNPTLGTRKRMEYFLARHNESYVFRVMQSKFRVGSISELTEPQLKQLCVTIANRPNAKDPAFKNPQPSTGTAAPVRSAPSSTSHPGSGSRDSKRDAAITRLSAYSQSDIIRTLRTNSRRLTIDDCTTGELWRLVKILEASKPSPASPSDTPIDHSGPHQTFRTGTATPFAKRR